MQGVHELERTGGARARDGREPVERSDALPRAIRPAVEIITRLSGERSRLREEVARLRDELRAAPRPAELIRLQAERDALVREVAELKAQARRAQIASGSRARRGGAEARGPSAQQRADLLLASAAARRRPAGADHPLAGLVERLERAVARLETPPAVRRSATLWDGSSEAGRPAEVRRPAAASRPAEGGRAAAPPGPAAAGTRGGGLLAGLVRDNLALRGGADAAAPSGRRERELVGAAIAAEAPAWARDGGARAGHGWTSGTGAPSGAGAPAGDAGAAGTTGTTGPLRRPSGGGFLGGLVSQNLALRRPSASGGVR